MFYFGRKYILKLTTEKDRENKICKKCHPCNFTASIKLKITKCQPNI